MNITCNYVNSYIDLEKKHMAKKSLSTVAKQATERRGAKLTDEQRNEEKRLTFIVSGGEHLEFKKEAADAGLSMTDYFYRLWKNDR